MDELGVFIHPSEESYNIIENLIYCLASSPMIAMIAWPATNPAYRLGAASKHQFLYLQSSYNPRQGTLWRGQEQIEV
jgi:hypothetical protein